MRGAGAGEGPTASAVMGDIIDVARGYRVPVFGIPAKDLADPIAARSATPARYYLRMRLLDKPGALAKIATCIGDAGISIDQMRQINRDDQEDDDAIVLIVTHKAAPADIEHALTNFKATGVLLEAPVAIRIEEV